MPKETPTGAPLKSARLSLDVWAVLAAFLLALLVRLGVISRVPW